MRMSRSATPATQNHTTTCFDIVNQDSFCNFPYRTARPEENLHSVLYTLRILHSALQTSYPTPHTPHFTLYILLSTFHTTLSTLCTSHPTYYTLHSTFYTFHFALHTLHFRFSIPHFILYTPHSTIPTPRSTYYIPHSIFHIILLSLHSTLCILPHSTFHNRQRTDTNIGGFFSEI